ncbi:MAG: 1,4-alpha-glucan branching protein GlgB [Planctomycetota bacterium]|nr:MAG: 1,4-alpha-glucan branching protein GlgB [Planctomycetota bacterium]
MLQTDTPTATQAEQRAMRRGMSLTTYRHLGAHPTEQDGIAGVYFAVWAPNAREVCVVGDFNHWRHGAFYLNSSPNGVWYGFIPGIGNGTHYKYSLRSATGQIMEKCDPYAFACECPPKTANIVYEVLDRFEWHDAEWLKNRSEQHWSRQPVSIYEVHLGSWRRPWDKRRYNSYRETARELVAYAKDLGFTHLQLMPVSEYPFDGSWGYQPTGYFAPTARYGTPDDFQFFVDYCHQNNIGVLIDWVPGHFPTDGHGLGRFDGTALYEHEDPRKGFHPDWNTYIFNYGRHEVRNFLLSNARFWCEVYHVDGIRVDAVASMLYLDYSREAGEWIPNERGGRENLEAVQFLKDMNVSLHAEFPGIMTVAEESTSWPLVSRPVYDGGLGFGMKWDMGWMNDTLRYFSRDPIHRSHHQSEFSFRSLYAFTETFTLPLSHDEVVHGKKSLVSKMPGDAWQQFANLRLLLGTQFTTPGKPLLFMGGEFGQWREWNHDSELDWALLSEDRHSGMLRYVRDLNRVKREQPALHELDTDPAGFRWINADDAQNCVFTWIRQGTAPGEQVVVVLNMTPVPREHYRIGVPDAGVWREILNSDAKWYGGTDVGNGGEIQTESVAAHGCGQSLVLTLPPLGMLILKRD